ncbi:MAG: nuclear transport factor 2 family protein [Alphaproteobacteria bacterium]|jgi:ketosteroid isomerase-like protein|nr:nuclear transport factor 2 family protein [Alphaproteobacteria bacterium]
MDFGALMAKMTGAASAGDGAAVAECFTPDGTYHDVFYGAFTGADAIQDMIENYFHRDAANFRWDLHDPVDDGETGYVRYVFSYDSKLPEAGGKRALFEGIGVVRLKNGLIAHYSEVANTAPGLLMMGFAPERMAKIMARQGDELKGRDEAAGHIPD